MMIKFWGVRGSIPCPGPRTVKYGGNTPCIELRIKERHRVLIIDAGSGIRELGNFMVAHDLPRHSIKTELFISHTHWDHIMGFPFFAPIYIPGTSLKVYGPVTYGEDRLEDIVGGQLAYRYFPVRETELAADIEYIHLQEGRFDLGDGITLITKYLNHPILCFGFRFEYQGKVFCTSYDTEPFRNLFCADPGDPAYDESMAKQGEIVAAEQNAVVENFFAGADLLVHDAQYTQAEYEASRLGWGHSSIEHVVAAANRAGVKLLALFHYDPVRTDAQIDELAELYCKPGNAWATKVLFAREGMEFEL